MFQSPTTANNQGESESGKISKSRLDIENFQDVGCVWLCLLRVGGAVKTAKSRLLRADRRAEMYFCLLINNLSDLLCNILYSSGWE